MCMYVSRSNGVPVGRSKISWSTDWGSMPQRYSKHWLTAVSTAIL
jgi:hypothetical protein